MAKHLGRDMLWKVKVAGSYVTVGGLRARKLTINNSTVDVTTSDSLNAGTPAVLQSEIEMGIQKIAFDGTVLFDSDITMTAVMDAARLQTALDSEVIMPGYKTFQCATCYVTKLEGSADHQKEFQAAVTLEMSGVVTAT